MALPKNIPSNKRFSVQRQYQYTVHFRFQYLTFKYDIYSYMIYKHIFIFYFFSVYDRFFFIYSIKSPQFTSKKKKFDSDFSARCFDVPKTWNFTSSRVQNCETKNRRLGMIVTSFQDFTKLIRGKKISQTFSYCNKFAKKWYKSALFIRK